jgi:hypothetical protein
VKLILLYFGQGHEKLIWSLMLPAFVELQSNIWDMTLCAREVVLCGLSMVVKCVVGQKMFL